MPDAREEFARQQALKEEAAAEGSFHRAAFQEELAEAGAGTAPIPTPEAEGVVADPSIATMSQGQLAWRRFRQHKLAIASAVVLLLIVLAAIFAPLISRYGFAELNPEDSLQGPGWEHFFGTDTLGRDNFTRVLYGGRVSLFVGIAVAILATVIGTWVGAMAGYFGGWIDNLLMRITDLFLSIPAIVILIMGSLVLGGTVIDIVLVLGFFFWMADARIVRGLYLSMKEKEFVEAAHASGASNRRIIFKEMLPNAMGPIIVSTTLAVAYAILTESVLSFLGYGIQPPTPTWGNLLDDGKNLAVTAPWLIIFPGLAILITVMCVNFLGDGLRDAFDPQGKTASLGGSRRRRRRKQALLEAAEDV